MAKNINLKSIDLKSLPYQSQSIQLGIGGIVIVVILILTYFFVYGSMNEQINQLKQEEEELKQSYTEKSVQASNLDTLRAELNQINSSFQVLLKQLPTNAEIPNLIQELHESATQNGLSMDSVSPAQINNQITTSLTSSNGSDGKEELQVIETLPYNITLSGNYNQISQFVRDIGKLSRIVTLNSIVLKRNDKDNTFTLNAIANTYKALSDAEIKQLSDKR